MIIIASFLQGALLAIFKSNDMATNISVIVTDFAIIYADVVASLNLAKVFGKSQAFGVGLFFFPNVFQLILGFGKAEYQK